uniref:Uncharacterized protein n=1 Tax=Amphiprion ocellaris TaxID=80972 RepID=A0AAQ5X867_AMPOC
VHFSDHPVGQACARGHLVRSEIRCAQEDFEEIVKEIDGGLTHLKVRFRNSLILFSSLCSMHYQGGPYLQPSDPGLDVSARPQYPASLLQERDHCVLPEKTEAERDDLPSSPVGGDGEWQRQSSVGNKDGGVMESTGESSTIWSSLELDTYKGRSCREHGRVTRCFLCVKHFHSYDSIYNVIYYQASNCILKLYKHYRSKVWGHLAMTLFFKEKHFFNEGNIKLFRNTV